MDRRRFYLAFIYGINALIGMVVAIPSAMYLLVPGRSKTRSPWIQAADLSQLQLNNPEEVVFRRNRTDGWKVVSEKTTAWVVKTADNQAYALAPQCTHLGCAYHWDDGKKNFVCPCHTSFFSLEGNVLTGPAPRPLDRYETRIDGSKLLIGSIQKASGAKA